MKQILVLDQKTQNLSDDLINQISNCHGVIRLNKVRNLLGALTHDNIEVQKDIFLKWNMQVEKLILEGTKNDPRKMIKVRISSTESVVLDGFNPEKIRIATKCSKRGNDVYYKRLLDRLHFLDRLRENNFFSLSDFTKGEKVYGKALWFSLTFNSNLMSLNDAWKSISSQYNKWITNLRNKYGRIHALKFFQASPGKEGLAYGYPHIHVVLLFEDAKFEIFPNLETNKRTGIKDFVFRVKERDELKAQGKWHSFSDIKAIKSVNAILNYCIKHSEGTYQVINDDGEINQEALLNSATTWYYKKRAFSVSGKFAEKLTDLIHYMHNSKTFHSRIDGFTSPNWGNHGGSYGGDSIPCWSWKSFGVRSVEELVSAGLDPTKWVNRIEDPVVWQKIVDQRENY